MFGLQQQRRHLTTKSIPGRETVRAGQGLLCMVCTVFIVHIPRDTPWYQGTRGIVWYTHPAPLVGRYEDVFADMYIVPIWPVDRTLCYEQYEQYNHIWGGIHCEQWQCTHMIQPCARPRLQYLFTPFSSTTTRPVSQNKNNQQFFKTYKEERSLLVYLAPFNGDCMYYS